MDGSFKFTRSYAKASYLESRSFKHRKRIRFDKSLLRAALVNESLASLFADLEAEANWRAQALETTLLNPSKHTAD